MSACGSCGAAVIWAITAAGNRMPVDPEPAENGNLYLFEPSTPGGDRTVMVARGFQRDHGEPLYLSHFVTCPNAARHRRPR
jgi:hypothetical protein